ncbi:MAG TPA: ATP-binding protein, partial [Propionibacteriaceae bacterium]
MAAPDLRERVFDLLVGNVDDDAVDLALAALDGDHELDEALGGADVERPDSSTNTLDVEPAGAFLKSLTVEGFRGVGAVTRIDFHPAPGLTIVTGRNGSGKSSLAEALEFALTSKTHRWHNAQFTEVWRNLHHGDPCRIGIELAQEGVGKSEISVSWGKEDDDTGQATVRYQQQGGKQQSGLGALGWAGPLEAYRPILSYEELGRMLSGTSSQLYDALAKVL